MKFHSLQLAINSLRHNLSRALLTIFGIVVGIAMVIIVMSAGEGVRSLILGEVGSFGDNWINIEIKVPSTGKNSAENAGAIAQGVTITTLTDEDREAIVRLDNIEQAYAGITTQGVITWQNERTRPMIFAVTPEYIDIDTSDVAEGQFFTDSDNRSAASVIVLGSTVKETLFGNAEAIGKTVTLDGSVYTVVGVMEEKGASGFFDMDKLAYIPLRTAQKKIMGIDHVSFIVAQMKEGVIPEATAEEIRWLLRERHDISDPDKDDFAVTTQEEAVELVGTIVFGLTALLIVLSSISLIVGGVGIMNVMYVSVAERTFEIGLRKSVGAKKRDILWQFLTEALVVTLIGGVIGIVLGIVISWFIAYGAQQQGLSWEFQVSSASIIISTLFSLAVGLGFGVYPAKQAASLNPVEALRAE